MSLTLPRATAVNCQFVALPDSLATNDNTLKLYNIDGGGGGGTTDAYTKAESDARFLRLAAPSQTISQIPNSAGIRMNSGAFLDWLFGATGTSQPFRFKAANGGIVNFHVSSPADLDSRNIIIPQISTGNVFFLVDRPTNPQTIYKSTLNLDYTGGTASSSAMLIKGYGAGLGNGLDFFASTQISGTRHIRFYAAPASLRGEVYDNGSGMCYQGNEANVNKLTLNGNGVTDLVTSIEASDTKIPTAKAVSNYVIPKTDIVTTVTGDSDSKVPSEKAVKTYVDSSSTSSSADYTLTLNTQDANSVWPDNLPVTIGKIGLMRIVTIKNSYAQGTQASYSLKKWNLPNSWSTSVLQEHVIMSQSTGSQNPIVMGTIFVTGNTLNVLIGAGNNTRTSTAFSFPLTNFSN